MTVPRNDEMPGQILVEVNKQRPTCLGLRHQHKRLMMSSPCLERCSPYRPPINPSCKDGTRCKRQARAFTSNIVRHLPVSISTRKLCPFKLKFVLYWTSDESANDVVPKRFPRRRRSDDRSTFPCRLSRKPSAISWSANKLHNRAERRNFMTWWSTAGRKRCGTAS